MWRSDGTTAGTVPVLTSAGGFVPNPFPGTTYGDAYFFQAAAPDSGRELWRLDASGANLFMDIWPGPTNSMPSAPLILGDKMYFQAQDPVNGYGWWTSDGTVAGTHRLPNINPNVGVTMEQMTVLGNRLYFTINDGVHGMEPWYLEAPQASTARISSAGILGVSPIGATFAAGLRHKQETDMLDALLAETTSN